MRAQNLFRSESSQILISQKEIADCLNKFYKTNPQGPIHPFIQDLQKVHDKLGPIFTLNNTQLQWLAFKLFELKYLKNTPEVTFACEYLYHKMAPLISYSDCNDTVFNRIASRPILAEYVRRIKQALKDLPNASFYDTTTLLEQHPDALVHIVKSIVDKTFTPTALNADFCEAIKPKGYEYLLPVCEAIDWLKQENENLYKNSQTKLDSVKNVAMIFEHPEFAKPIADFLIHLHKGNIEQRYKHCVEEFVNQLLKADPATFFLFSRAFASNKEFILKHFNKLLTADDFKSIVDVSIVIHAQREPLPYSSGPKIRATL